MRRISIPKRQRCLSSAISSSMFLLFMKSVSWFLHDCCGSPQVADRAMLTRYGEYLGNKIPGADQSSICWLAEDNDGSKGRERKSPSQITWSFRLGLRRWVSNLSLGKTFKNLKVVPNPHSNIKIESEPGQPVGRLRIQMPLN